MTDSEIIRKTGRATLEEMGYKIHCGREFISQNQALKLLKPKNIGRAKLNRFYQNGMVKFKKDNPEIRNSSVSVSRTDIYRLLNK